MRRNAYNDCDIIFNSNPLTRPGKGNKFHSVYAHEFDNIVILVQNIIHTDAKLRHFYIFISAIVGTFAVSVAFSKILRLLSKDAKRDISRIVLDALGSFLATNPKASVSTLPVKILHFSMVVFSILFGMFASTYLFGFLLARSKFSNIDRIDELATANLRIFITTKLNESIDQWSQNLE